MPTLILVFRTPGGMHYHNQQVPIHYRVCGQRITKYRAKKRECKAFSAELKIAFDIDTSGDDVNIHPEMFCMHSNDIHACYQSSPRNHCCLLMNCENEQMQKIRGIVSGGEASALIQKEVLILSDEERRSLLDKAGISSSIELGQLRWLKSPGICLAGEIAVFSFTISFGGEDIKGAPLVFIPYLVDKVVQLLDGNERTGRLTRHKGLIPANEIWLKIGGDKGGGTFKMTFQIVNVATPNSVHNTCVSSFLPLVTASPISMWHLIS
eukprot:Em0001g260a